MLEVKKTKILPPYLLGSAMLAMFALDYYLPIFEWRSTRLIAYLVMLVAFILIAYCAYMFHQNKTNIKPFQDSTFLILTWPYTFSRNPIYLFMIIFLLGWCLWLQSVSCLLVVALFALWIHHRFVLQEEVMMEEAFDESYLQYKQRTRRWL